jgi:hypothetical protein
MNFYEIRSRRTNEVMTLPYEPAFGYQPPVLLLTAYRWPTTTRLAFGLFQAGIKIDVLCPPGHSLEQVKFVSTIYIIITR